MRVIEYDRYGDPSVLQIRDRPVPAVRPGHVVVRIRACGLNPKDVLTRGGRYPWMAGRRFPKQLGYDWSGEAVAVGAGVTGVAPGDALFGMIGAWRAGACAEYACVRADELAAKPAGLDWESAAALPLAGSTALQALRDLGEVRAGHHVLLSGASGGVGVLAIQVAKLFGAHVTTLTSAGNRDLARSLGADEALDYQTWDPTGATGSYDTIFDIFGNRSFTALRPLLSPRGTYISTVPKGHVVLARLRTAVTWPRARLVVVRSRRADLDWLATHAARGAIRAVIDRTLPLADVAEAHRALATRRTRGKIILQVA